MWADFYQKIVRCTLKFRRGLDNKGSVNHISSI